MILFDGHDLETILVVGDPELSWLGFEPETTEVAGKDGVRVSGVRIGTPSVSMRFAVEGTARERRYKLSTLGSWLHVDGARELVIPDTPELRYMAVPEGSLDMDRAIRGELSRLTFAVTEPAAYGCIRRVSVSSGETANVAVSGTYPTPMHIEGIVTGSSDGLWGIRLDEGKHLYVEVGQSTRPISVDCESRTVTADGTVTLPTPESDWLELRPGAHTIRNDVGTGSVEITWTERWL